MYDYGFSSSLFFTSAMWVFSQFAGAAALATGAFMYVVLRVRDARGELHDPQLGVKVALHLLMTVSILLAVSGGSLIATDMARNLTVRASNAASPSSSGAYGSRDSADGEWFGSQSRVGLGMVFGGGFLALGEWWLILSRTNDRKWPATRRAFTGARTIIHGLVLTVTLTGALIAYLLSLEASSETAESVHNQSYIMLLAASSVWAGSLALHMMLLLQYTRQPNVPGTNYRCYECGQDLRNQASPTECPRCGGTIPVSVRRFLSQTERNQPQPASAEGKG